MSEARSYLDGRVVVHAGDCREVLQTLADNSVDSVCTDPPYHLQSIVKRFGKPGSSAVKLKDGVGIDASNDLCAAYARQSAGFMGRTWDGGDIAFQPELWAEVLRVLRPGATCLSFGGDRTVHRVACAMEDAGFEIQGQLVWCHGQGFPKNLNVGRSFSTLPWCSCGGGEKTLSATISSVPSNESDSTVGANAGITNGSSFSRSGANVEINAGLPPHNIRTSMGAETIPGPADRLATNCARRLGDELGGGSRHRRSAVNGCVEELNRNLKPVVLRSSDVTVMTERDQISHDVSGVQLEPKSLRDEMVGKEFLVGSAVQADVIANNNGSGNILPPAPFIRPSTAAPRGVPAGTETIAVADCHAGLGTIDGLRIPNREETAEFRIASETDESRSAPFESSAPLAAERDSLTGGTAFSGAEFGSGKVTEETDSALFAGFGRHAETLCALVAESKVLICEICGSPKRPQWVHDGLGTALKPAIELIIRARKPLSEASIAQNVLRWGTGAINVAGCRVGVETVSTHSRGGNGASPSRPCETSVEESGRTADQRNGLNAGIEREGRWPANLIHDGSDEVLACFPDSAGSHDQQPTTSGVSLFESGLYGINSGNGFNDSGSTARFFASFPQEDEVGELDCAKRLIYTAKADQDSRLGSRHPCVKPLALIQYLVRLITPPCGTVLDIFAGTGTTGEACFREGFRAILIEREVEYLADIERRMSLVMSGPDERAHVGMKARGRPRDDGPLFGGSEDNGTHSKTFGGGEDLRPPSRDHCIGGGLIQSEAAE